MKASPRALPFGLLLLLLPLTAFAQGPSLSPIPNVRVHAGATLTVDVVAVDPGEQVITLTPALPPFATLNTPTIAAGSVVTSLTISPSAAHVGDYSAAVTATAGGVSTVRVFQITVDPAGSDRAPEVSAPAWQEVTAGTPLGFGVTASDPDGDAIASLGASDLPPGASFTPGVSNLSGTFDWTPGLGDVGDYDVQFMASNALPGTGVTHVRVTSPPMLTITPIDDVTVGTGAFLSVPVQVNGLPGAMITLTASLPTFATLNPPGSGTGSVSTTVSVTPPDGSAGTYHASMTALSLGESVTEEFDIVVTGTGPGDNRAPIVTAPANATVEAGHLLGFDVSASDPDGDHVQLIGSALPPGSGFTDHGDDTGSFEWTPTTPGTYQASFTGLDGRGGSGSATTVITVTGGAGENHPPTLSAPATQMVQEGATLSFLVSASDPDGDPVALEGNALPFGASFTDHGDDTGTFEWTPDATQSGTYEVAFLGSDGRGGTGTAGTMITVTDVVAANHPPTVSAPPTAEIDEGDPLSFAVTANDLDGDPVALSATGLPPGATFTDHGDDTGTFAWPSGLAQPGTWDVTFVGQDGNGGSGSATTHVTVREPDEQTRQGDAVARACMIGPFVPPSERTCFRIRAVDHAFDLRDVTLSGIRLQFRGESIAALGGAHLELDCRPGRGPSHDDQGVGKCGVSCQNRGDPHEGDPPRGRPSDACDTLGIKVCFATDELVRLFESAANHPPDWSALPCALLETEILATLADGTTIVATFSDGRGNPGHDGPGDDAGDGHDGNGGGDPNDPVDDHGNGSANNGGNGSAGHHGHGNPGPGDDPAGDPATSNDPAGNADDANAGDRGAGGHEAVLDARAMPNPLAPATELSFTMPGDGRVSVTVYDMQGRLVKRLLDDFRSAGQQTLPWDGTDTWNLRVTSGVYFVRIQTAEGGVTRRVTVVK